MISANRSMTLLCSAKVRPLSSSKYMSGFWVMSLFRRVTAFLRLVAAVGAAPYWANTLSMNFAPATRTLMHSGPAPTDKAANDLSFF